MVDSFIELCKKENIQAELHIVGDGSEFKKIKEFPGLLEKYRYFTICSLKDIECKESADFYLEKSKLYLLRIRFDESSTTGKIEFSNEYLIDTTTTSDYLTKKCSG